MMNENQAETDVCPTEMYILSYEIPLGTLYVSTESAAAVITERCVQSNKLTAESVFSR